MKAFLILSLALVTVASAPAQIFRPGAGRGGPRDSRGGHFDRGHVQMAHPGFNHGTYIYRNRPSVYVGFGPSYYPSPYPSYGYYPGYGADYPYYGAGGYYGSGSAASSGLWLGALAGGIIGNNSGTFGHNGLRGAAWGAGLGWLLGSVADANRPPATYRQAPGVMAQPAQVVTAPPQAAASSTAPQQITIINNYYNSSTPMSGANNLFGR